MNPYEPADSRPNEVVTEESNEVLSGSTVQESSENTSSTEADASNGEVLPEKEASVANRDFSEDLKLYMAKYPAYQHMLGMNIPMRSYMWSFFSGIVNMALCEEILKDTEDSRYYEFPAKKLLEDSKGDLTYICEHFDKDDPSLDIIILTVISLAFAYLKLAGYENKFVVPALPEEKDTVEGIVEKETNE